MIGGTVAVPTRKLIFVDVRPIRITIVERNYPPCACRGPYRDTDLKNIHKRSTKSTQSTPIPITKMALPLSPIANAALNIATPPTSFRQKQYEARGYTPKDNEGIDEIPSSPFVANVSDHLGHDNISPSKQLKHAPNLIEKETTSIQKVLESSASISIAGQSPTKLLSRDRSPCKLSSPEKRFPVKASSSSDYRTQTQERTMNVDLKSRGNKGLAKAIEILEDEGSMLEDEDIDEVLDDAVLNADGDGERDNFADETAFSNFSAVPDMTMFAKIGHSPIKYAAMGQTPRALGRDALHAMRKPIVNDPQASPTPRRSREHPSTQYDSGNTTNLILDFTEQFNNLSGYNQGDISPTRRGRLSPTKSQTVPDLFTYTQGARTPSSNKGRQQPQSPGSRMSNLLDFDIPPAPTPRSMPTITPRELESLKSAFMSEISSLKASLSGKEAEILSLKAAVGDAEKRVGESMEQVREERNVREQLAVEKEEWEKRGREMEAVLRNVKQEIVHGDREREALEGRLEESEKRREAAEIMAQEAESKMAGMRAGSSSITESNGDGAKSQPGSSSRDVEVAVEKVARELHTLYKSKHETKVAALKKSYESRWDRKVKDLEAKLDDLGKENEELKIGRDATMSGVVPRIQGSEITEVLRQQAARDAKMAKELEARLQGLAVELKSVKSDNNQLRQELDQERVEKGELVAACDELLALQETGSGNHPAITSGVDNLRGSISRASGLRAPNFASGQGNGNGAQSSESRIGRVDRNRSGSAQGIRPGSGLGMRSGIMSSIEKMGAYKGRAE
jgi:hypothetical protein